MCQHTPELPAFIPASHRAQAQPITRAAARYHNLDHEFIALGIAVIALMGLWAIGRALIAWVVN